MNRSVCEHPSGARSPIDGSVSRGVRKIACILLAAASFVLAMIGIVLPVLPTTPFLLLTACLLSRSWPRMHRTLLGNRFVGPLINDWQRHRAVSLRVKIRATVLVLAMMAVTAVWSELPVAGLAGMLALTGVGVAVIHCLPTLRQAV
ncbi:MAG: YbaN family protein [Pirellulales bacterium]|nr:YbaN family protein [Pirellulales bacterium]